MTTATKKEFSVKLTQAEVVTLLNAIDVQFVNWSKTFTPEQIEAAPDDSAMGNLKRVQAQLKPMAAW